MHEPAASNNQGWIVAALVVVIRSALLLAQLIIAAFYAVSAVLMWGPFMEAPLVNKCAVAAIVLWPIVGAVVTARGAQFLGLTVTSALALLTLGHVVIVLTFVISN